MLILLLLGILQAGIFSDRTAFFWDIESGLPSTIVHKIHQTSDGFIWIATENGLVRFDGVRFEVFNARNTPALATNHIQVIFEDSRGRLWIGTRNAGLALLENGEFHPVYRGFNDHILAISEDTGSRIWIGTDGGGAYVIDESDGKVRVNIHTTAGPGGILSNFVRSLHPLPDGRMLLGNIIGGLSVIAPDTIRNYGIPEGFPQSFVSSFIEAEDGGYWAGTNHGIFHIREQNGRFEFQRHDLRIQDGNTNVVFSLIYDESGNLLVGTARGLVIKRRGSGQFELVPGYEKHHIMDMMFDREGNLWVANNLYGLEMLKRTTFTRKFEYDKEKYGVIRSFRDTPNGDLLIATHKGLFRWADGDFIREPFSDQITEIEIAYTYFDDRNRLWASDLNRVFVRDGDTFGFLHFDDRAESTSIGAQVFATHPDGSVWIGSIAEGIQIYRDGKMQPLSTQHGLSNTRVNSIVFESDGTAWIGTGYGLNRVGTDGQIKVFHKDEGLLISSIMTLRMDQDDVLWIGTSGDGLYRLKDGSFFRFRELDGFDYDTIGGIIEDDFGYFWITGPGGVLRVSRNELNAFADGERGSVNIRTFHETDGLASRQLTGPGYYSRTFGVIIYSTVNGVVKVDPARILANNNPPLAQIMDARVDFESVPLLSGIVLQPDQLNLEIAFTGINFSAPDLLRFRYRLVPFDPDWVESGARRSAFYTNIPPGQYVFEVQVVNENGIWNENLAQLAVMVRPAFTETWYFKVSVLLLFLLAVYALYRYRLMNLKRIEELRVRIAYDLHDEIGSNLGSIALRSQMLSRKEGLDTRERDSLFEIDRLSRQTADAMRDIIWLVNPERDKMSDMVEKLRQTALIFLGEIPVKFDLRVAQPDIPVSLLVRRNILLIFKEALHNILKHSGATQVDISIASDAREVRLVIADNGRGIRAEVNSTGEPESASNAHSSSGLGLKSMRDRAAVIKGTFRLDSAAGEGTRIEVTALVE